jgi:hypothetical protein
MERENVSATIALSKGLKQSWSLISGLSSIGVVVSIALICLTRPYDMLEQILFQSLAT